MVVMNSEKAEAHSAACENLLIAAGTSLCCSNALPNTSVLERCAALNSNIRLLATNNQERVARLLLSVAGRYSDAGQSELGDLERFCTGSVFDGTPAPELLFSTVVEAADTALDRANASLDHAAGIKDAVVGSSAVQRYLSRQRALSAAGPKALSKRKRPCCVALDIPKPQINFHDHPVDNSDAPFVPFSERKLLGMSAIDMHLRTLVRNNSVNCRQGSRNSPQLPHPFQEEIMSAAAEMPNLVSQSTECILFKPMTDNVDAVIDTEEELFEAAQRIHGVPAVAVDLENHSVRSFQGFTCLIQISTRHEDFVIDALALRASIPQALGPVLQDASILKVMHGAEHDVQWLERDFGLHVVNLFDTGQAARLLCYPSISLAFLLQKFADVDASRKQTFQTADWRQRPLPDAMIQYARSDTHYLLYIHDRLISELKEKKLLQQLWAKSADIARTRYSKERYDSAQPLRLAAKYGLQYSPRQMMVLSELCKWRDAIAREEDESIPYVMSNKAMFTIVRGMEKARKPESLLNEVLSGIQFSSVVRENADALARLVSDAQDAKVITVPQLLHLQQGAQSDQVKQPVARIAQTAQMPVDGDAGYERFAGGELCRAVSVSLQKFQIKAATRSSLMCESSDDESSAEPDCNDAHDGAASCTVRNDAVAASLSKQSALDSKAGSGMLTRSDAEMCSRSPVCELMHDDGIQSDELVLDKSQSLREAQQRAVVCLSSEQKNRAKACAILSSTFEKIQGPLLDPGCVGTAGNSADISDKRAADHQNLAAEVSATQCANDESSTESRDPGDDNLVTLSDFLPKNASKRKRKRARKARASEAKRQQLKGPEMFAQSSSNEDRKPTGCHVRPCNVSARENVYNPLSSFVTKADSQFKKARRVPKNPKSGHKSMSFHSCR